LSTNAVWGDGTHLGGTVLVKRFAVFQAFLDE